MDAITLDVQPRELGKAAARAVRRAEEVPCVLYGPHQEPVHFRVPVLAMRPLIFTTETHRVAFSLGGEEFDCILKDVTYHPVTDVPVHADFYALTAGEAITVTVPVVLVGVAPGVKAGGMLSQPLNEVEVRCLPADIPGHLEIDISGLDIGDSLHVSDLAVENAEIETDPARTVVTITVPMAEPEPEEEGLLLEGEEIEGEGEGTEEVDGEPTAGADEAESDDDS